MPRNDYIPNADSTFLAWHDQFKTALAGTGAGFGLTVAEINSVNSRNTDLHTKDTAANAAVATAKQATQNRADSRVAAEEEVRKLARRIKAHKTYTAAIGQQLGIEGSEDTTDLSAAKPKLAGRALPHAVVELTFNKSKSDGVNLYSQREGENGGAWTFLARDTQSPYVDNRPLLVAGKPEVRQYKAIYVRGDAELGQASDEVVVTCQP